MHLHRKAILDGDEFLFLEVDAIRFIYRYLLCMCDGCLQGRGGDVGIGSLEVGVTCDSEAEYHLYELFAGG